MGRVFVDGKLVPFKNPYPPEVKVTEVVRLSPMVYAALRKQLGGSSMAHATHLTTEIQAGYMLGINHVLNVLQEGFVTQDQTS